MGRNENEIDKQKFTGVMDSSSDLSVVKKGNHRSSYGFRSISANDNTFIFSTIKGTEAKASVRDGYKICCWDSYENSIYVLSKKFEEPLEFSFADVENSGKIALVFGEVVSSLFDIGDWIYVEFDHDNPYTHIENNGAFQVLSFPDQESIEIDIDGSLFYDESLGIGTGGGIIEPLNGGEIGELKVDPDTGNTTYLTLYWHKNLLFSFRRYGSRESSHINKENSKILRWYFTDYLTEPKVFNIRADRYRKVISSGNLVNGQQYMVTNGTVTYDGTEYGPDLAAFNVFTATTSQGLTYTGSGRLIEYYPVELLEWNPDFSQGDIQFTRETSGGQVAVGTYSAIYRCYDDEGAVSPWSMPTQPIYLAKGSSIKSLANYHEQQGSPNNENSGKKLAFDIRFIDTRWTKIQVAIIKHTSRLVAENPLVFYDEDIISSQQEVIYDGTNTEFSFNLAEITAIYRYFKKVMSIESMQEISFTGNFESGSILSAYEAPTPAFSYVIKSLVSDEVQSTDTLNTDGDHIWNSDVPRTINETYPFPLTGHEPDTDRGLYSGTWYIIEGVASAAIGVDTPVTYFGDEVFLPDDTQVQSDASSAAVPLVMIKKHQEISGIDSVDDMVYGMVYEVVDEALGDFAVGRQFRYTGQSLTFAVGGTVTNTGYDAFINRDYLDGNGSLVQNKLATYPRNEKIRIGIVPVDLKGNKLPVRWLGDYTTPDIQDEQLCTSAYKDSRGTDRYTASLNHLGLKIGTVDDPIDVSDIIDQISGFHIVIAPIVRKTKVMGLMYQTQRITTSPVLIAPEFWTYLDVDGYRDYYNSGDAEFPTTYTHGFPITKCLFSPDVMMRTEEDLGINSNDLLKVESYYDDEQYEDFEDGQGGWTQLKGVYYQADPGANDFEAKNSLFFKYQKPIADQTTNKSNPGSTVSVEGVKKYQLETSGVVPAKPNINYRTTTVSEETEVLNDNPFVDRRQRSRIPNHLLITHDEEETFGLENVNQRHAVLASIVEPGEASYDSVNNSQYVATGHFQKIDQTIKDQTNGVFYDVEVFGGQTFLSFYSQQRNIPDRAIGFIFDDADEQFSGVGLSITFPCESQVNPYRRIFEHVARDREELNDNNQPESFVIDEASKYDGTLIKFNALQDLDFENTLFEKSIAFSLTKIQGERFDSYRRFPFGNIKTTEGDMERIIAIKQSDQFLIVWHEKGVSYYPINDRAAITDNQGGNIRIGYGGIADQNISLSFSHGLQDRMALVETDNVFMWVSKKTRQIMILKKGSKPVPFGDENLLDASLEQLLPQGSDQFLIDDPYFTYGITGVYDSYNKEVLFSFINSSRIERRNVYRDLTKFKTLVIDANYLKPTGYFPFVADLYMSLDRFVYATSAMPRSASIETSLSEGMIVYYEGDIYIALETTSIPDPISDITTDETFENLGSFSNTHLLYDGVNMKFFGVEQQPEFTAVFNMPLELFKRFDAYQLRCNQGPNNVQWFTDVVIDNLGETPEFDARDYSFIASLGLSRFGARPRGHGIEINFKWLHSNTKLTLRQIDLFFKFINQK